MIKIKVNHNQNLLDIAVQYTSSAETVFEILKANEGIGLTDDLIAGQELNIPQAAIDQGRILSQENFAGTKRIPASALPAADEAIPLLWDEAGFLGDEEGFL